MLANSSLAAIQEYCHHGVNTMDNIQGWGSVKLKTDVDENARLNEALNIFLKSVEKQAFILARLATSHVDDSLDIVQDAMIQLVKSYKHRPQEEWKPLFFKILRNAITDYHRKQGVRNRFFAFFKADDQNKDEDKNTARIAEMEDRQGAGPEKVLERDEVQAMVIRAVGLLPDRQQQVFLLRGWLEFDVKETASIMGCSQGSVKTHYSRATMALKNTLNSKDFK